MTRRAGVEFQLLVSQTSASIQGTQLTTERPEVRTGSGKSHASEAVQGEL